MDTETPETTPPAPPPFDPRRRLRELLSVPERDRTDAQWDEINELEIQLAPGNRATPGGQPPRPYPAAKKFGQKGDKGGGGGGKNRQRPRSK